MRDVPKLAVALAALLSGDALAADFKGIELGQPLRLTQEKFVFGTLDCNPNQLSPDQYQGFVQELQAVVPGVRRVCTGSTSIAAVAADVTVLLGASRRVLRMTFAFDGRHFSQVQDAISQKWGDGIEDSPDEPDSVVWWVFDDGTSISIHRTLSGTAADPGSGAALVGLVEYTLQDTTPAGDL